MYPIPYTVHVVLSALSRGVAPVPSILGHCSRRPSARARLHSRYRPGAQLYSMYIRIYIYTPISIYLYIYIYTCIVSYVLYSIRILLYCSTTSNSTSTQFYSTPFFSAPFYSVPCYSNLFRSVPFCSILSHSILILFYSIPFYSTLL